MFDKTVKDSDPPPYPTEAFYDAKLWQFCRKQGAKGALIWNVSGSMLKFCLVGSRISGKSTLGTTRTGSKLVLKVHAMLINQIYQTQKVFI